MSFILDALRKSENERRRQAPPAAADVRVMPGRQQRSPWIALVALLVGANILLLAIFWFGWYQNSDAVPTFDGGPATPAAVPDNSSTSITGNGISQSAENSRIRNLSKEASRSETRATSSAMQGSADIAATRATANELGTDRGSAETNLPTLNEAVVAGILSVPPLHLDIHVYSPSPAERFVFVNMTKYREGERLQEGPAVEEITASGVIMVHQGTRFLLSRE